VAANPPPWRRSCWLMRIGAKTTSCESSSFPPPPSSSSSSSPTRPPARAATTDPLHDPSSRRARRRSSPRVAAAGCSMRRDRLPAAEALTRRRKNMHPPPVSTLSSRCRGTSAVASSARQASSSPSGWVPMCDALCPRAGVNNRRVMRGVLLPDRNCSRKCNKSSIYRTPRVTLFFGRRRRIAW
jgi:hypothetical protein